MLIRIRLITQDMKNMKTEEDYINPHYAIKADKLADLIEELRHHIEDAEHRPARV